MDDKAETLRKLGHIEDTLLEIEDRLYELNVSLTSMVNGIARIRATQLRLDALLGVKEVGPGSEPPA